MSNPILQIFRLNDLSPLYGTNPHIIGSEKQRSLQWHVWLGNPDKFTAVYKAPSFTATLTPSDSATGSAQTANFVRAPFEIPQGAEHHISPMPAGPNMVNCLPCDVPNGNYIFRLDFFDAGYPVASAAIEVRVDNTDLYLVDGDPLLPAVASRLAEAVAEKNSLVAAASANTARQAELDQIIPLLKKLADSGA